MLLLPIVLIIGAVIAAVLIYLEIQFLRMGEHKVENAVNAAKKALEKGKLNLAEKKLLSSLRMNGWDYQTYIMGKKSNKTLGIEQTIPGVTRLARVIHMLPKKNLDWVLPALALLGEIYTKQGKSRKAVRLYEDILSFIEGYGEDVPYVIRMRYLSKIHQEQSFIEGNSKNPLGSLRLQMQSYFEKIASFKAAGDEQSLLEYYPYTGDNLLDANLKALERTADKDGLLELVNRLMKNSTGRINTPSLLREVDSFMATGRSREEAELGMARDIIQKALSKVTTDDEEEDKDKKKPTVIHL